MNPDGSDKKRLYGSDWGLGSYAPPIWSPNGQMIAFGASTYNPATHVNAGGTFVINADGTGLRMVSPIPFPQLSWQPLPKPKGK
jgi:hypothetical protein